MVDIIAGAQDASFKVLHDDPSKQGIAISYKWKAELEKHPYHSSKCT